MLIDFNHELYELWATDARLANVSEENPAVDQCSINNIVKHVNGPPSARSIYGISPGHLINDFNPRFCFIIE